MTRTAGVLLVVLAAGCEDPTPPPPPPPQPPQVFLTIDEPNVIGTGIKGRVNVSGCKNVTQVQLLQQDSFLFDVMYSKSPTEFTLPPGLFSALYSRLGIAASLTLKAKAVCDDARTNTSQPVGVKFFPIAQRYALPNEQIVQDRFIPEGGLGGSANTFLGCVGTQTGTTIARVDLQGNLLQFIASMPFPCSLNTRISDVSPVTGTRWVLEPGAGAFVMQNSSLMILKEMRDVKTSARMGVGRKGQAVVWIDESGRSRVRKMDPTTDATNDWTFPTNFVDPGRLYGIMNSDPAIDDGAGLAVWITDWRFDVGSKRGTILPFKLDLRNGALLNGLPGGDGPAAIIDQQFPLDPTSMPIMPEGVFNSDGSFFTVPAIALDAQSTTILSCATGLGLCEGAARRWSSTQLPGILRAVVPFSNGNVVAVVGPYSVYFLNGTVGNVINLGEVPLQPSGTNVVVGVQPGLGTDFYVMTGPDLGPGVDSFAMEIIATDAPQSGELWRLEYGSGENSGNSMWMGIDDAQTVWIRVGADLIKPLSNTDYRMARGATMLP